MSGIKILPPRSCFLLLEIYLRMLKESWVRLCFLLIDFSKFSNPTPAYFNLLLLLLDFLLNPFQATDFFYTHWKHQKTKTRGFLMFSVGIERSMASNGLNSDAEEVVRRCSVKKVFLKFYKIHRKTPVPESLF